MMPTFAKAIDQVILFPVTFSGPPVADSRTWIVLCKSKLLNKLYHTVKIYRHSPQDYV